VFAGSFPLFIFFASFFFARYKFFSANWSYFLFLEHHRDDWNFETIRSCCGAQLLRTTCMAVDEFRNVKALHLSPITYVSNDDHYFLLLSDAKLIPYHCHCCEGCLIWKHVPFDLTWINKYRDLFFEIVTSKLPSKHQITFL